MVDCERRLLTLELMCRADCPLALYISRRPAAGIGVETTTTTTVTDDENLINR